MPSKKFPPEDAAVIRASRILDGSAAPDADLLAEFTLLAASYKKLKRKFHKTLVISDSYQAQHQEALRRLEEATYKYRQLRDLALPICMHCKKIRSDDDYWHRLEIFFAKNTDLMFTHGICPDCIGKTYDQMGPRQDKSPLPAAAKPQAARSRRGPAEDDALKKMRTLVQERALDGDPHVQEMELFTDKYGKLLRRFNKTVSISDSYQSQLMELKSRLELVARTDLLTGLASRWEMMARLEAEKDRSDRYGSKFSILLADIDHFKSINDNHGHLVGDKVLRGIADTLRCDLRSTDVCGRWGGEEFLILLPECDLTRAKTVAEKLLRKVRKSKFSWEGNSICATMSVGYGEFIPGMSLDDFIKGVDDALYSVKTSGRDGAAAAASRQEQ